MKRDDALRILTEHRADLQREFGVKSLALFGSVARDEATEASDVDLLVEFDRPIGLFHLIGTEQFIAHLLGVTEVDLVLRRSVLPELKTDILAEEIHVL